MNGKIENILFIPKNKNLNFQKFLMKSQGKKLIIIDSNNQITEILLNKFYLNSKFKKENDDVIMIQVYQKLKMIIICYMNGDIKINDLQEQR